MSICKITIELTDDLLDDLEQLADLEDKSVQEYVSMLIVEYVADHAFEII